MNLLLLEHGHEGRLFLERSGQIRLLLFKPLDVCHQRLDLASLRQLEILHMLAAFLGLLLVPFHLLGHAIQFDIALGAVTALLLVGLDGLFKLLIVGRIHIVGGLLKELPTCL